MFRHSNEEKKKFSWFIKGQRQEVGKLMTEVDFLMVDQWCRAADQTDTEAQSRGKLGWETLANIIKNHVVSN